MVARKPTTRRNVLRTVGASTVGLVATAGAVSGSEDDHDQLMRTAKKILRRRGPEARAEFLRNHGYESTYQGGRATMPDSSVSTSDVDCIEPTNCDGEIEVNISIDYNIYNGYYSVGLQTRYKYLKGYTKRGIYRYDGPQYPKDGLGLYWDPNKWQITDEDYPANSMYSPTYGSWDNGSWIADKSGTGFRIDDNEVCKESSDAGDPDTGDKDWSDWDYCGVDLYTQSDWTENSEVRGEYVYVWNETNLSVGVSASYPPGVGVSVSGTTEEKKEDFATNLEGKSLIVDDTDL